MVALVNSFFKPDQHETPQKRKMKDKYNHVIQVVILIFFRDLQWIKFIFQGSNRIGRLTGTVHIHNKDMAVEKMSVGESSDLRSAAFNAVFELLKEVTEKAMADEKAEDSLWNVETEQLKEGDLKVVNEEDEHELFAIGTLTNNPLRLRGGAGVDDSNDLLTSDQVDNSKHVDDCTCYDDDGSSTSDNGDVRRTRRSVSTKKRKECDDQMNEPNYEAKSGARFLQQLDRDYLCSPRLIVRGEYTGQVLKVIAKRKTEGTMVDWTIFDMNKKTQLLNVKGEMTYPYGLVKYSHNPYVWHFGSQVKGGWQWQGYGWGFINLFPNSNECDRGDPTKILHIDIEEAVFYQESVFHYYHLSGQNCRNVSKSENINCKEDGCGLRIWSIKFTSYTTAEEEPQISQLQPKRRRKEREVAHVFLSLVAFFDGEYKLVLHRDCPLKKYIEEVAWLAKDVKKFNDDFAAMNTLKIDNARYIWSTTVPKPVSGGNTLVDEVNISEE